MFLVFGRMSILVGVPPAHTAEVDILPNTKNIHIPQSLSDRKPSAAVVVMVTKDSVYVDGNLVGSGADWSRIKVPCSRRSRRR